MNSGLIGVIPAAGLGTRMGSLTRALPKALLTIDGQTLLENAIESLKSIEVSKIKIVIGHLGETIREFVLARDFGVAIDFAFQERQLGLAHAISMARDQIFGDFVLYCPDNIYSDPSDLLEAKHFFLTYQPSLLMLATVHPTNQRDRAKYFSGALRNLGPQLYQYDQRNKSRQGFSMTSTGCTFFSKRALQSLPSFSDIESEHRFENFINAVAGRDRSLIYLLRGMRYDLSEPHGVMAYESLQQQLENAEAQGVSAILINREGKVLLQHRDDNPGIRYPGHWSLFGGTIEPGEPPHIAAAREIKEEIGYDVLNLGLFREFIQSNKREFAFVGDLDVSVNELCLNEGQGMDFISPSELRKLQIRPDDKETLKAYFGE